MYAMYMACSINTPFVLPHGSNCNKECIPHGPSPLATSPRHRILTLKHRCSLLYEVCATCKRQHGCVSFSSLHCIHPYHSPTLSTHIMFHLWASKSILNLNK